MLTPPDDGTPDIDPATGLPRKPKAPSVPTAVPPVTPAPPAPPAIAAPRAPSDVTPSIPAPTSALTLPSVHGTTPSMPALPSLPTVKDPSMIAGASKQGAPTAVPPPLSPAPTSAPGAAPAAATPQLPAPPPPPSGSVPTTGIDPSNDLRSASVLPQDDPHLTDARTRLMGADASLGGYDRVAAIKDAMGQFGSAMPGDVAPGADVGVGPSEQGALDTLSGQVSGAAGKVAGYDRNADVLAQRKQLTDYFGNTDVATGPEVDAGKDYSGDVNTADASTMGALGRVTGTTRGTLARGLRDEFGNYLKPTDLSTRGAVDPTASARLASLSGMTDASAGNLATVDRVKLAQDLVRQFSESTAPEYDLAMKTATERAAAAGGSRSGMLRTKYGDLALTRARDIDLEKRRVMSDALSGSIDDAFRKTSALQGLEGQVAGQDAATRGERRTERGYATGIEAQNIAAQQAAKNAAAGLGESAADATIGADTNALNAARGVSSELSSRQQVRGANQRADRAFTTGVQEGNVGRRLSTRQAAQAGATSQAGQNFDTTTGALSTLAGLQGATAGREANRRGELRTERDTGTGLAERNAARRATTTSANRDFASSVASGRASDLLSRVGSAHNLFSTLGTEGTARRAEVRGERGYQNALEGQSYDRAVTQEQLQQQELAARQRRALDLLGAGEAGNPSGVMGALAEMPGIDPAIIAQLAATLGRTGARTSTRPRAPAMPTPPPVPSYPTDVTYQG